MKRFRPLIALAGAATLAVAGPALAHTRLVSSNPAANATVSSPRTITLTFNEPVLLTSQEIAREVGGTAASVRGKLARAVARLRRELTDA